MRSRLLLFCLAILAASCGDAASKDGDSNTANNAANNNTGGEGDCSLNLPLDGAVSETLAWGTAEGCAGATSGGLVTLTFGAFGADSVQIGFTDTMFGEPGTHDTYVLYRNADGAEWNAQSCSVDITTNEVVDTDPEFGDTYRFAGSGRCAEPATGFGGGAEGEVTIGDFDFSNPNIPGPN